MKRFAYLIFLCQFTLAYGNTGTIFLIPDGIQGASSHTDSLKSAYDADEISYKLAFSFVPQYAMIGGLRFDMDIGITANHWIQAAPIVFISDSMAMFSRAKQLRGMGIHLYHRYYPANGFGHVPVYFSWGPIYHFTHIKNGARSSGNANSEPVKIHKAGMDVIIGFYAILGDNFMLDMYAGMGVRHAFFISDEANPRKYNDTYFDYGYSGNILILGMRFGIPVK